MDKKYEEQYCRYLENNIPIIQFFSGKIILYDKYLGERTNATKWTKKTRQNNITKGQGLSPVSKRKLKKSIDLWVSCVNAYFAKHKRSRKKVSSFINFATLTLSSSQVHSDKFLKRHLLQGFIKRAKRKVGLRNYIWFCEKQDNSNLHFHILVDRFINAQVLRAMWNAVQNNYGYIARFKERHKHDNPNSTDIRALKEDAAQYATKEVVKTIQKEGIDGWLWGSSDGIKKLKVYEGEQRAIVDNMVLEQVRNLPNTKEIFINDFSSVIVGKRLKTFGSKIKKADHIIDFYYSQMVELYALKKQKNVLNL